MASLLLINASSMVSPMTNCLLINLTADCTAEMMDCSPIRIVIDDKTLPAVVLAECSEASGRLLLNNLLLKSTPQVERLTNQDSLREMCVIQCPRVNCSRVSKMAVSLSGILNKASARLIKTSPSVELRGYSCSNNSRPMGE